MLPVVYISSEREFETINLNPEAKSWTYMIYFCADTRDHYVTQNLDNSGNVLNMAMQWTIDRLYAYDIAPGSESNLNVIALYDHPYSEDYPYGQAKLYELQSGGYTTLANYGARDMGSHITLQDFIDYCKTNYPADNYALTLSDHGRGYAGFCYDYHSPHPYYDYALGDCLTVDEMETAISNAGGVDVLFLDTCLGGSFEVMWELHGEVDYVVAGETLQTYLASAHPRDIVYELSRDTTMSPLELATVGFDSGVAPVRKPSDPQLPPNWPTIAIYNLNRLHAVPPLGGSNLATTFSDFVEILYDEIWYNITRGREIFGEIRGKMSYYLNNFKSDSMMVDLKEFVIKVLEHSDKFHYQADIEVFGTLLLNYLNTGSLYTLHSTYAIPENVVDNMTGFSICFPDTEDMYQEYLYPNFYEGLDISLDTLWDEFIFSLYPAPGFKFFKIPYIELYEIQIGPIDPTVHLHVYFDQGPVEGPLHIGYGPPGGDYGFGIEVEIPGASFVDDLLTGACTIRVPVASMPSMTKSNGHAFSVVVNASSAASTAKDVNLTVRHIDNNEVIWEDTKTAEIEIGQAISTNVTTDDTWTDFEELSPPIEPTGRFGISHPMKFTIIFVFGLSLSFIIRKRKRNKRYEQVLLRSE
jgi:hypothetical protein